MSGSDKQLADELLLDMLERMRLKYDDDREYGEEVRALMIRLGSKLKVRMN